MRSIRQSGKHSFIGENRGAVISSFEFLNVLEVMHQDDHLTRLSRIMILRSFDDFLGIQGFCPGLGWPGQGGKVSS